MTLDSAARNPPAAVVEYEQITFAGQTARDEMGVMLADDPLQMVDLGRRIIRSQLPDKISAFLSMIAMMLLSRASQMMLSG